MNRDVVLLGFGQSGTQVDQQALTGHFREAEAWVTGSRLKIGAGAATELENLHILVNHNAGGNKTVRENPIHLLLHGEEGWRQVPPSAGLRFAQTEIRTAEIGNQLR